MKRSVKYQVGRVGCKCRQQHTQAASLGRLNGGKRSKPANVDALPAFWSVPCEQF